MKKTVIWLLLFGFLLSGCVATAERLERRGAQAEKLMDSRGG